MLVIFRDMLYNSSVSTSKGAIGMKGMGERLAEARKSAGLTQSNVAEKLNVTTQSVSAWECGTSAPDLDKLPELASLYRVTTDWLLTGKLPSINILEITSGLSDRLFDEGHMATYVSAWCTARKLYGAKRALAFAKEKHSGQYRKPGHTGERVPYINHPLLLTCHAIALGLDEDDLLSACLLHDVCEDCGVKPEELPVSDEAKEAVRLLTKAKDFDDSDAAERAYYDAIAQNRIATIVKLLDRCGNVSEMSKSFSDEKMAEYIRETMEYVYPLMAKARDLYPECSDQFFLIRYHMNSVIGSIRHYMRSKLM